MKNDRLKKIYKLLGGKLPDNLPVKELRTKLNKKIEKKSLEKLKELKKEVDLEVQKGRDETNRITEENTIAILDELINIQTKVASLIKTREDDLKSVKDEIKEVTEKTKKQIENLPKTDTSDLEKQLEELGLRVSTLNANRGGSANQKVSVGGTWATSRYADINFVIPGSTVSNDDVNKNTKIDLTNVLDKTVSLTGGGITVITGTYPNFTITSTEADTLDTVLGRGDTSATRSITLTAGGLTAEDLHSTDDLTVDDDSFLKGQNFLGGVTSTSQTINLGANLVSHWLMNDNAANTIVLDNKSANQGTLTGGDNTSAKSVSGKINTALQLNGSDDWIDAGTNASLAFTTSNSFSGAAWIKTSTASGYIVDKMRSSGSGRLGYEMYVDTDGHFVTNFDNAYVAGYIMDSNFVVTDNAWHHVAFTYNGTSKLLAVYVDGSLKNSGTSPLSASSAGQDKFCIGVRRYDGSNKAGTYFNGTIDDVRIYNATLSAGAVDSLYALGVGTESEGNVSYGFAHQVIATSATYSSSHTLDTLKDLAIEGKLEVDDRVYFDSQLDVVGDLTLSDDILQLADNKTLTQGAGSDFTQKWDGTNEVFNITSGKFSFDGGIMDLNDNALTTTGNITGAVGTLTRLLVGGVTDDTTSAAQILGLTRLEKYTTVTIDDTANGVGTQATGTTFTADGKSFQFTVYPLDTTTGTTIYSPLGHQIVFYDDASTGGLSTLTIANAGSGYNPGTNYLEVEAGSFTGVIQVTADAGGAIVSIDAIYSAGYNYSVANDIGTLGGGNEDCTVNITGVTSVTYDVQLDWDAVAGAEGYRIIIDSDPVNGYVGNYYVDVVGTNTYTYDGTGVSAGNTVTPKSVDLPATALQVDTYSYFKDKIYFTQTDANEYIDSLADGYMDYGATTAHRFNAPVRSSTASYRRYYHLPLGSANPGASGATWVEAGANTTGGWRLTNATWILRGQADVHSDWDGASDMKVGVNFMVNVNNTGGGAGDTVDLKLIAYYKGIGDTATKSQTVEVATTVGQSAQYKQFRAEFTLDYDATSNVIEAGDILAILLNLETDTSEVDDIVVTSMEFWYNKTHVGTESGDV